MLKVSELKHIPVEDIQKIMPCQVDLMDVISNSDVSFGNNTYTLLSKTLFKRVLGDIDEINEKEYQAILAKIPDDVCISIDC